jgi:DUF971 family protein
VDIRNVGDEEILMTWNDGHRSLFSFEYLRFNCPCAACRDEWTGKRLITLDKIQKGIKPSQTSPVGRYALKFRWSDGHDTGIYGFDFLRGICPCETCGGNREA